MVKVQIHSGLKEKLERSETQSSVGLIVGAYPSSSKSSDIVQVLHLAPTTTATEPSNPSTLANLRTSTLTHHTRQLLRTIPGGLHVIGLYSTSNGADEKVKAKSHLQSLTKSLSQKFANYCPEPDKVRIFISYDGSKKGFAAYFADNNADLKECPVTFGDSDLLKVETDMWVGNGVAIELACDESRSDGDGNKSGEGSMFPTEKIIGVWKDAVSSMKVVIDNRLTSDSRPYVPTEKVAILVEKLPAVLGDRQKRKDFVNVLHMKGKIHLLGYVFQGESTKAVENSLKVDLLRSLTARLQMHTESLVDEDDSMLLAPNPNTSSTETTSQVSSSPGKCPTPAPPNTTKVFHELPRRVFVKLFTNKNVFLTDYLFPGEGPADCVESFDEILGLRIKPDDIDESREGVFDIDTLSSSSSMEEIFLERAESIAKIPQQLTKTNFLRGPLGVIFLTLGIIVAGVAIGWGLYLKN